MKGIWLTTILGMGCADMSLKGEADTGYASNGDRGATTTAETDWDDTGTEVENNFLNLLPPAATVQFVFVANPDRDTVTRISVPSLEVITANVGEYPLVVQTVADTSTAVTLNVDSDDISIIDSATLSVTSIETRPNLNQMKLSPDGRWAIAYHDPAVEDVGITPGTQSFYEISILDLQEQRHVPAVVGFEPQNLLFTPNSETALLISDAKASVIDLSSKDPKLSFVDVADDQLNPPTIAEVTLAPDGSYAFLRHQGSADLQLLDMVSLGIDYVTLSSAATDLDLSSTGTEAIAIAKEAQELWILDVSDPLGTPEIISLPNDVFGSVVMSPDDTKGLLFTTQGSATYGVWDRTNKDTVTIRGLEKSVTTMGISPDGGTALVLHPETDADVDPSSPFYGEHALTMIGLSDFRSNALVLPGEPSGYANSDDGAYGYLIMEDMAELDVLEYSTLLYESVALGSAAEEVGVLPETTWAYVSQSHDLGRISFFDSSTQILQTLTGFELNAAIEQE